MSQDKKQFLDQTGVAYLWTRISQKIKDITPDSAYDVAVQEGFEGSEEEWLASLQGASGVYLGTEKPSNDYNIWIDPNGDPSVYKDEEARQAITALEAKIPTTTSELINDANFATIEYVDEKFKTIKINRDEVYEIFLTTDKLLYLTDKSSGSVNAKVEIKTTNNETIYCFANIRVQGSSSASYAKKNYTIKFYSDEGCSEKLNIDIGWGEQYHYCFKANYVDTTHTRNITGARVAYDMVESRPDSAFKTALQNAPRNGLIDGFPVKMYLNGEFHGIYTWNIPKDGWMFGMDEDNPNHVVLCATLNSEGDGTTNSCQFRELWGGADDASWEVEFGEATEDIVNSFNKAITSIINYTPDNGAAEPKIIDKFDIDSLIDYYIFSDFCCHLDGLANNLLMVTYDGIKWGASLYDMDTLFGAWWDGSTFVEPTYSCPDQYQEPNSKLWEALLQCFPYEIKKRYFELRNGALSLGNIITHAENLYNSISDRMFADEHEKWPNLPSVATNTITRFRNWLRDRAAIIDEKYRQIDFKTSINLITQSLEFTNEEPQRIEYKLNYILNLRDGFIPIDTKYYTHSIGWICEPKWLCDVINGDTVVPLRNGSGTLTLTIGGSSVSCPVTVSGIEGSLDYIESDGTQYIDTGYFPKYYTTASIYCNPTYNINSAWGHLFGSDNIMKLQWAGSETKLSVVRQGMNYNLYTTSFLGEDVKLEFDNDPVDLTVQVNDVVTTIEDGKTGTYSITSNYPLYIFSGWDNGIEESGQRGYLRFYGLKLEEYGKTLHYFVPRLDNDGIPCVYDIINHTYHYNQNATGNTFIYA